MPVPERPPNFTLDKWVQRFFPDERPDVIVSGDTHVERITRLHGILCVNPGSATYPHNYDTQLGTIGFLEIDAGRASARIVQLTDTGTAPFQWGRNWR